MHQKIIFLLSVLLLSAFYPIKVSAIAGIYQACPVNPQGTCGGTITNVCYEGLVPCGYGKPLWKDATIQNGECNGTPIQTDVIDKDGNVIGQVNGMQCQFCHFFVLIDRILDFLVSLTLIIAVALVVLAGFFFIISTGNPGRVASAMSILKNIAVGLIIIFVAWVVVNTFFILIDVASWTGLKEGWFSINCLINLPTGASFF